MQEDPIPPGRTTSARGRADAGREGGRRRRRASACGPDRARPLRVGVRRGRGDAAGRADPEAGRAREAGRRGPATVPASPRGRSLAARGHRERSPGAGPLAHPARQPADRPRDGQPDLERSLRRRPGADGERLRQAGPAPQPPRPARRPGPPLHGRGMVGQGDAPDDPALGDVRALRRPRPARRRGRSGRPSALAVPPPSPRRRGDPRRDAGPRRRPRPIAGRPAPVPPGGDHVHAAQPVRRGVRDEPTRRLPDAVSGSSGTRTSPSSTAPTRTRAPPSGPSRRSPPRPSSS